MAVSAFVSAAWLQEVVLLLSFRDTAGKFMVEKQSEDMLKHCPFRAF